MQNFFSALQSLLLALSAAVGHAPASADQRQFTPEFRATVIGIQDGDTVEAMRADGSKTRVRLANIDAPETHHGRCKPGQPYAQKAGQALKALVHKKSVVFQCSTLDRYDRHVCDIVIGQTTANRELARQGLVWANRAQRSYLRDPEVAAAEREAQGKRLGIWSDGKAVEPWRWRKEQWRNAC